MTAPVRYRLIANPVAGRRARRDIERSVSILRSRGAEVDLFLTTARGDAQRAAAAADAGYTAVIAAGGDGTLNEVVNGLAPATAPLGVLPLGTTNVFALEAGIPFDVEGACEVLLSGEPRPVATGLAGDTRFLLMAGIGFDAEVVRGVRPGVKRLAGKLAYLVSTVEALARGNSRPLELVDETGERRLGYGAIIGNGRCYGGAFSATPGASVCEEGFEVCLLLRPGRWPLLRLTAGIFSGRGAAPEVALLFRARHLTARGEGVPVQIDGDYLGLLPMTFEARFGELRMIFPRGVGGTP